MRRRRRELNRPSFIEAPPIVIAPIVVGVKAGRAGRERKQQQPWQLGAH